MSELYELPEGWEWEEWKNIVNVKNGKNYKEVLNPNGKYPIYGSGGIMNYADEYLCNENTTIIGRKGTINSPIFVKEKFWNIDTAFGLESKEEYLIPMYLYYFTLHFDFLTLNKSTTLPSLAKSNLQKILIPLPPLQEQKRIVAKLDSLFAKIDQAIALHQQNIDEADALMGSVLNEVFGELEERYGKQTLNDVFLIARGGSPRPIKDYITNNSDGINWIKISDATKGDGKYIESTEQKIRPEGLQKSRLVEEGDFIMSNSMSFGRPYIMKTKGAIHDGWLLMREKIENIDREYFYYLFSSNYMYQQFVNKASGTTVKNLNIDLVKSSYIISPPLDIQQKTVTYLDQLSQKTEKLKQAQQEKMQSLKDLKASLLDRAFRGEL